MPVNFLPLIIAIVVWIAGTIWIYRAFANYDEAQGAQRVEPVLGTAIAAAFLAVALALMLWLVEWMFFG